VDTLKELDNLNKTSIGNICVIHGRNKDWKEVVRYAEEALTVDPLYVKALFYKGRAHLELTEYQDAITHLTKALELEPENAEVKRELARADQAWKKYQDKESKMF
jgi:tetratricopeptide (TPR) repeat protein